VTKLDDFDIVAAVGHNRGTMRSFDITSDGNVDIDLKNVVENPLINGIEIVTTGATTTTDGTGVLLRRSVDSSGSPTAAATTANTAMDWSTVRGAFLVNGTLYYGLKDGGLYSRTFNTSTAAVGSQRVVNLYDDPDTGQRIPFAIANVTGMFYDTATHRIYYTVFGDAKLYYRYFTPESEIVGADTFTANGNGVDFSKVAGMTLAGGKILYGSSSDGALRSVGFGEGKVTGSPAVASNDGSWTYRAISRAEQLSSGTFAEVLEQRAPETVSQGPARFPSHAVSFIRRHHHLSPAPSPAPWPHREPPRPALGLPRSGGSVLLPEAMPARRSLSVHGLNGRAFPGRPHRKVHPHRDGAPWTTREPPSEGTGAPGFSVSNELGGSQRPVKDDVVRSMSRTRRARPRTSTGSGSQDGASCGSRTPRRCCPGWR
jgi:hypothetical protein